MSVLTLGFISCDDVDDNLEMTTQENMGVVSLKFVIDNFINLDPVDIEALENILMHQVVNGAVFSVGLAEALTDN